jgi:hypothetical protein
MPKAYSLDLRYMNWGPKCLTWPTMESIVKLRKYRT